MNKKFKIREGEKFDSKPNEPIININGTGKNTYLWIGNDAEDDKFCFATLSGPATLLKLANGIIEAIEGWKPVSEIKRLKQELSTKQTKSRPLK